MKTFTIDFHRLLNLWDRLDKQIEANLLLAIIHLMNCLDKTSLNRCPHIKKGKYAIDDQSAFFADACYLLM